jgi:hypothetical protein
MGVARKRLPSAEWRKGASPLIAEGRKLQRWCACLPTFGSDDDLFVFIRYPHARIFGVIGLALLV